MTTPTTDARCPDCLRPIQNNPNILGGGYCHKRPLPPGYELSAWGQCMAEDCAAHKARASAAAGPGKGYSEKELLEWADANSVGECTSIRALQGLFAGMQLIQASQPDESRAADLLRRIKNHLELYGDLKRPSIDLLEEAYTALQSRQPALDAEVRASIDSLDTPERVCFYEQEFYVLSNFSSFQVQMPGGMVGAHMTFNTSEEAYHFEKFPGAQCQGVRFALISAKSAHDAFKIAQEYKHLRRPDWDEVKLDIMRIILRAKVAQHEYVRRKLLETGSRTLIENSWRDDYWGWGSNKDGQNMLGKLWMEIRAEFAGSPPALTQQQARGKCVCGRSTIPLCGKPFNSGRDQQPLCLNGNGTYHETGEYGCGHLKACHAPADQKTAQENDNA
jgi:ribA/ribD-fused uncharacterized protein